MTHNHQPTTETTNPPERVIRVLGILVAAAFTVVVIGAVLVLPVDNGFRGSIDNLPPGYSWEYGKVVSVNEEGGSASVVVTGEEDLGAQEVELYLERANQVPSSGDNVRLLRDSDGELYFTDFDRRSPLLGLFLVYLVVVIAVAWWRGVGALFGLAISFAIILFFTVPALFNGQPALLVGLVSGAASMFVLIYLAHGFNTKATTALLGTLTGLAVTGLLGWWAVEASHMTGFWVTEGITFTFLQRDVSMTGVVLCAVIFAGLGVLNDVTITQASAVWELWEADPTASKRELYTRGMRIGRDHIAATVYTITFAYLGAGLPIIMMSALYNASLVDNLTSLEIAEEIVRTLVGSIGLILAVPLTTVIAVWVVAAAGQETRAGDGTKRGAKKPVEQRATPPGAIPERLRRAREASKGASLSESES